MQNNFQDRKEQIIYTAIQIISEEGVKKLTLKNIASRIGISDAALYRHFKNKHDIIQCMIGMVGNNLTKRLSVAVVNSEAPLYKLKKVLKEHLAYIENNKGLPRIIFSESVHQNDPVLRKLVLNMVNNYLDFIKGILVQARENGKIRKEINIDAAAHAFFGLVQATVLIWSLSDFEHSIPKKAEALFDVYSKGLK